MFKSLYKLKNHEGRIQPEAILTVPGVIVMILIYLLHIVIGESVGLIFYYLNVEIGTLEANLIANGITLALIILFFHGFLFTNLKNFFKEFKAIYIWLPITCYFCSTFANVIIQMVLAMIRGEFQSTSNNEAVATLMDQAPIEMILLTVVLAPVIEEAVFRAALSRPMTAARPALVKALGLVISVTLFAFLHVWQFVFFAADEAGNLILTFNPNELLSMVTYVPMGIAFVVCSWLGKNYWCSVLCHALTNGIAVAILLLQGK